MAPDRTGWQSCGSRAHEQLEDVQAGFLGECSECGDDELFLHYSNAMEM